MQDAIGDGELIFVNKIAYGLQNPFRPELLVQWKKPQSGEIVIYMFENAWVVKRCAAVSGDTLVYQGEDSVLVNGKTIPLTSIQFHRMRTSGAVPLGYVFAVGDNYGSSMDSRSYGFVPEKNILARVIAKK